jgi:hypothetical protein
MPTKNRRKFIPRALKMWREQDYPSKELIVIEDGDDNVSDLLGEPHDGFATFRAGKQYTDEAGIRRCEVEPIGSDRPRYYRLEGTLGAKLNLGRDLAAGSILLNFDDDDFNAPNRISLQVQHLQMTGKPFVGFSSLIYYREGQGSGQEFTGDAWYAPGSTHCYTRAWALAHPRPDKTLGEDNVAVAEARAHGALSTISGTRCLVACDHWQNCSPRRALDQCRSLEDLMNSQEMHEICDNIQIIPLSGFADTIACGNL